MSRIARVFPSKNSHTPDDDLAFFDVPGMFMPEFDEVHICTVFTWDIPKAEMLKTAWEGTGKPVFVGGPAYDDPCDGEFIPGRYLKQGITFTSRGCPNNCSFCFVPKREQWREIPNFAEGNVIQDNNFLATSKEHRAKVYQMLKGQKTISFQGGLEAARLTDWDIEQMRELRIHDLWLAADSKEKLPHTIKAIKKLREAGFSQNHIRSYVLIGDDMAENEDRLMQVFRAGALPFAQLYQPEQRINYSTEWKQFARTWSRPACMKARMMSSGG